MPSLDAYYNFIARQESEPNMSEVEYRWTIRNGMTMRVPAETLALESGENSPESPASFPSNNSGSTELTLVPGLIYKNGADVQSVLPTRQFLPPQSGSAEWLRLPRHLRELSVYIPPPLGEEDARHALLERLLDPTLTLEETAKLLGVCTATVRRYANSGKIVHQRTPGNQRRFRLSEVAAFLHRQNGVVEEDE